MKAETLSQIEIKKTFLDDLPEEILPSKSEYAYLVHEYVLEAQYIKLKNRQFKEYLYQNVMRYLPINKEEFLLRDIKIKEIGIGLILEKVTFNKKKTLYILRDKLLNRVYIVNDKKGMIENIVNIALEKIIKKLQSNPRIKVNKILITRDNYEIYFDDIMNLPPEKEYRIRGKNGTFVLSVTFIDSKPLARLYYYDCAIVDPITFNRFVRFLLYEMYHEKD